MYLLRLIVTASDRMQANSLYKTIPYANNAIPASAMQHTCYANTPAMQTQLLCKHTCYANTPAMQTHLLCKANTCKANTCQANTCQASAPKSRSLKIRAQNLPHRQRAKIYRNLGRISA